MDASIKGDGWIYRKNTKGGFEHYSTGYKLYKKKKNPGSISSLLFRYSGDS